MSNNLSLDVLKHVFKVVYDPRISVLKKYSDEKLEDKPLETLLLWVNFQLQKGNHKTKVTNFIPDLQNCNTLSYLLMELSPETDFLDILMETSQVKKSELFIQALKNTGFDLISINASSILNGNKDELIKFISNLFLWRPNLKLNSPQKKNNKENEIISKKELDLTQISMDINKNENDFEDIFSKYSTPLENINETEHENGNGNENGNESENENEKKNSNKSKVKNENQIENEFQTNLRDSDTLENIFNSIEKNEEPFSITNIDSTFSNDLFDDILKLTSEITIPIDKILDKDTDILKNPILDENNPEILQNENETKNVNVNEYMDGKLNEDKNNLHKTKILNKKTEQNNKKNGLKPDLDSLPSPFDNTTRIKNVKKKNVKHPQKKNNKPKSKNIKISKPKPKKTEKYPNKQKSFQHLSNNDFNNDLIINKKKTNRSHSTPFTFSNAKDPILDLKRMSVMFGEGINFFEGLKREINNDMIRFHSEKDSEDESNNNKENSIPIKKSSNKKKKKQLNPKTKSNKDEDNHMNKEEYDEKINFNNQDNVLELSNNNKSNKRHNKKKKKEIAYNQLNETSRDCNKSTTTHTTDTIPTTNTMPTSINNKINNHDQKKNSNNNSINIETIDSDNWIEINKPNLNEENSTKTTMGNTNIIKTILPKKNIYQKKLQTNKFGKKIRKIGTLKRKLHEKTLKVNLLKLNLNQKKSKLNRIILSKELSLVSPQQIINHSFNMFVNQLLLLNPNSKEHFQKLLNYIYNLTIEYDQMKIFLIKIYEYFGISLRNINQNKLISTKKKKNVSNNSNQNNVNKKNEQLNGNGKVKVKNIKLNPNQKLISISKLQPVNKSETNFYEKWESLLKYQIEESNDIHLLKWVKKYLTKTQSNISHNYYSLNILNNSLYTLLRSFLHYQRQSTEKKLFTKNNLDSNMSNDQSSEGKVQNENEIEQEKQNNRKILNYIQIKIQKFGFEKNFEYSELLIEIINYLKKEKIIKSNNSIIAQSITLLFDSFGYSTLFYKKLSKLLIKRFILKNHPKKNLNKQKRLINKLITKFDYHFPSIFNYREIKNEIKSLFLQLNEHHKHNENNNTTNDDNDNDNDNNNNNNNDITNIVNSKEIISYCRKITLGKIIKIIVNRTVNKKIQILLKEYIEKNKNTKLFKKLFQISKQIFGKYLLDKDLEFIISIFDSNNLREFIEPLSSDLFYFLESIGLSLPMIQVAISHEIERCKEPKYLFRSKDMATKLLMKYTRVYGEDFLKSSLKMIIVRLCSSDLDFEIDPFVITDEEIKKQNLKNLNTHFVTLVEHMFQCVTKMPTGIKFICNFLQIKVKEKFTKSSLISVAGFIFLRWICPTIVSPHNFEIVNFVPSERARRGLILLSSMVQNLASKTSFGETREYMQPLNQTIIDFFDQRKLFLKQISNCEEYKFKKLIKKNLFIPISQKHYPDATKSLKPEFVQLLLLKSNLTQNEDAIKNNNISNSNSNININTNSTINTNNYKKFSILFTDLYITICEFEKRNNPRLGKMQLSIKNNDQIDLTSNQIFFEQEYTNLIKFILENNKIKNLINKILSRKNIYQKNDKSKKDTNTDLDNDGSRDDVDVDVNVDGDGDGDGYGDVDVDGDGDGDGDGGGGGDGNGDIDNDNEKNIQRYKDVKIKVMKDQKKIFKSKSSPRLNKISFSQDSFTMNNQKPQNKKLSKKKRKEMKNNIKQMKKIKEKELIIKWQEKNQKKIMFEGNGYYKKGKHKKKYKAFFILKENYFAIFSKRSNSATEKPLHLIIINKGIHIPEETKKNKGIFWKDLIEIYSLKRNFSIGFLTKNQLTEWIQILEIVKLKTFN
ncbi:ras gtpase-activating protein [Anaeramoeba flamelloides]|uniref:Ras gtpase-activating protein n=1 Tax=Anaeramoeba flamelloides TaxID=1746091 RepID=A0AAV7YKF8_9EUKA|nr:ras gtpase-activating protein [Anaeramoeba flamelloides]